MEPLATNGFTSSAVINGNGHHSASGKHAVILAGGRGTRLGPYTTVLPKPLLPIGDGPILDVVLRQLAMQGFSEITLAVGYLAHLIEAVFNDGSELGVSLRYHREAQPLGTVGPLATMDDLDETFLVMNGDVLTTLDYNDLYEAHVAAGNMLTIATHVRTVKSDYGVLEVNGDTGPTRQVTGFREKPEIDHTVSMGVYVLDRRVCEHVPCDRPFDLPELVWRLLELGERVGAYRYDGFWLDIGRHEDYAAAIDQYEELKPELLREVVTAGSTTAPNGNGDASRNGHGSGVPAHVRA
jgi:NDP-mannose synthase